MYTREITSAPENLIQNGKPVFGTFFNIPQKIDIKGVVHPFGVLPLPTFISDLRIRSSLLFIFNNQDYIGTIEFFDARLFGHAEIILWEKSTNRKLAYRTVIGPRRRLISKTTTSGGCISFGKKRYIRISWNNDTHKLSVIFNMKGDSVRPHLSAAINADISEEKSGCASAVLPAPIMRRCRAVWLRAAEFSGSITLQEQTSKQTVNNTSGQCAIRVFRSYYKLRTKTISVFATGDYLGKQITFSLTSSSLQATDSYKYNENFLFTEQELTPLPPVKITFPLGIMGTWVIQDTENMVDLSFTPISDHSRTISIFILRTQSHSIYGTFNGEIKTKNGESIVLKDFPGTVRKQLARM